MPTRCCQRLCDLVGTGVELLSQLGCAPLPVQLKPDLWSVDLHLPHLLEWNFMNSTVKSVCAFDGILRHDAESGGRIGTPLYLPRREPVHIITGRRERHRDVTLAWLKKWHVSVASLTMMANDDQREIAEYKAEAVKLFAATAHQRLFGEAMFVKSCPVQARKIVELSEVMVVCPATRKVLGREGCWLRFTRHPELC